MAISECGRELKIDPRRDGIERHLSVDGFAEGDTETAGRSPEDARRVHQVAEEHTRAPGPRPALSRRPGHCPVSLRNAKNHNHSGPRNPPRSPLRRFQTADVNVKKEKKKKGEKKELHSTELLFMFKDRSIFTFV